MIASTLSEAFVQNKWLGNTGIRLVLKIIEAVIQLGQIYVQN